MVAFGAVYQLLAQFNIILCEYNTNDITVVFYTELQIIDIMYTSDGNKFVYIDCCASDPIGLKFKQNN